MAISHFWATPRRVYPGPQIKRCASSSIFSTIRWVWRRRPPGIIPLVPKPDLGQKSRIHPRQGFSVRTQVGIVGAGPAGMFLALLLRSLEIECVVVEQRDREYAEGRV